MGIFVCMFFVLYYVHNQCMYVYAAHCKSSGRKLKIYNTAKILLTDWNIQKACGH